MFHPPDPDRPPTLIAISTSPDAAGSIGRGEVVGRPGRSAAAYYRRRRAAEWILYRRTLPLRLFGVVAAGLLCGVAGQEVAPAVAGWLAALTSIGAGWRLRFRVSEDARNWRRGARGERRTARQLNRLTDRGWVVFHDLAVPGSRANVDHLAIGPSGIFLIDSKNWRGRLVFAPDGTLWHGSYPMTAVLATIGFEVAAIAGALGTPSLAVEPLIVIHGSTIPWGEQFLGGVGVLSGRQLVPTLLALPPRLSDQQITDAAERAINRLRPAL
jgi:nuclease-like protein